MLKPVAIALSLLFVVSSTAASGEDQTRLPAGHYIYLGSDANTSSPKAFTITSGGSVSWQGDSAATAPPNANSVDMIFKGESLNNVEPTGGSAKIGLPARADVQRSKPEQRALAPKMDPGASQAAAAIQPRMENIEKVDWPVIKFSPKQIPGSQDGFAQLTTTLEIGTNPYQGVVKYKLILLRAEPEYLTLQLLDANGFMLHEFAVSSTNFQPMSGTALLAARGSFALKVAEYDRARDFSLTTRVKPMGYSRPSLSFPSSR